MKVSWNKYLEILPQVDKTYLEEGCGTPFGGMRLESEAPDRSVHSIVLTRSQFKKIFGTSTYRSLVDTLGQPKMRMTQKPWYEYDDYHKLQEKCEEISFEK